MPGARYYDSELARWLQSLSRTHFGMDPLADKYPGWSGYNNTLCNPLRFIDPNVMWVDDNYDLNMGDDGKFFADSKKSRLSANKENQTSKERKSSTPTFVFSLGGSFATLFGHNGSIGIAINPGEGNGYGFIRHGMSGGVSASGNVGVAILNQDLEDTKGSGSGLTIAPEKNTSELEGGIKSFGGSLIINSDNNGKGIVGGSFSVGFGYSGISINETFQSYETKTYNLNLKNINNLMNPSHKPLKYYR